MKKESGRMKVKVLDIKNYRAKAVEDTLNEALRELRDYYVVDVKALPNNLVAIMYFSKKKSESFKKHDEQEEEEED